MQDTYSTPEARPSSLTRGSVDHRARLSAFPAAADYVYGSRDPSNIMHVLHETNGMIFPYRPNITQTVNIQYDSYSPMHSNQSFYAFKQSESVTLMVSGLFTAQNQREKEYVLAIIHFLRTVSKMRFGENDPMRGAPPPMLHFSAYGSLMYNRIPVIIQNFQLVLPDTADYVHHVRSASIGAGRSDGQIDSDAWLPSKFDIVLTMVAQRTPAEMRKQFSWERFRNGDLLLEGGWF